jgi:putative nucleotidyltransferase with HDIG domain
LVGEHISMEAKELLQLLKEEIRSNKLVLPTLPEVALRVRDAVESDNATAGKIADIVATDAALSARLMQVANSPLYRGRVMIEDIKMAVTRLGNALVRNLVTSIVIQQMFQATSSALDTRMRALWAHSIEVAAISRALASQYPHILPDQAMLAGLVHDIGALPILVKTEEIPELLDNEKRLDKIIHKLHPIIGKVIMNSWGFPETMIEVATQHENLDYDGGPQPTLVDIVIVANIQSKIGTPDELTDLDWDNIPAFQKLGLQSEVLVIEMEGMAEQVDEVHNMFET